MVFVTISRKRGGSAKSHILEEVAAIVPRAKALSGDPAYAVDFSLPSAADLRLLKERLGGSFVVEESQALHYLGRRLAN